MINSAIRSSRDLDALNPRVENRFINLAIDRAETAIVTPVERFEPALVCLDGNLAEAKVKSKLMVEGLDRRFTAPTRPLQAGEHSPLSRH